MPVRLTLDIERIMSGLTEAVDKDFERVTTRAGRFKGSKIAVRVQQAGAIDRIYHA
jgi:hypothetical protein